MFGKKKKVDENLTSNLVYLVEGKKDVEHTLALVKSGQYEPTKEDYINVCEACIRVADYAIDWETKMLNRLM